MKKLCFLFYVVWTGTQVYDGEKNRLFFLFFLKIDYLRAVFQAFFSTKWLDFLPWTDLAVMLLPNVNSSPINTFTTTFISWCSFQGQNENLYSWDERNIFDTVQSLDLGLSLTKRNWYSIWTGGKFLCSVCLCQSWHS